VLARRRAAAVPPGNDGPQANGIEMLEQQQGGAGAEPQSSAGTVEGVSADSGLRIGGRNKQQPLRIVGGHPGRPRHLFEA